MFNYNKIENDLNILHIKNNNIIQQPQKSNCEIDNLFFKKENNDKKSEYSTKSMISFEPSNKLKKYLVNDSENNNNNIENKKKKKKK